MQVHAERRKNRLVKISQEEPDNLYFILIFFISHKSKRKEGREDRRQRKKTGRKGKEAWVRQVCGPVTHTDSGFSVR